jgi:hypothetical protein
VTDVLDAFQDCRVLPGEVAEVRGLAVAALGALVCVVDTSQLFGQLLAVTVQVLLCWAAAAFGPAGQVFFGSADGALEFLAAVPQFGDASGELPVVQQADAVGCVRQGGEEVLALLPHVVVVAGGLFDAVAGRRKGCAAGEFLLESVQFGADLLLGGAGGGGVVFGGLDVGAPDIVQQAVPVAGQLVVLVADQGPHRAGRGLGEGLAGLRCR